MNWFCVSRNLLHRTFAFFPTELVCVYHMALRLYAHVRDGGTRSTAIQEAVVETRRLWHTMHMRVRTASTKHYVSGVIGLYVNQGLFTNSHNEHNMVCNQASRHQSFLDIISFFGILVHRANCRSI